MSRGLIPDEVRASVTVARLSAAIGLLGASMKGSRRAIAQVLREVLGCPMALGSVCAREKELCRALAGPHEALVAAQRSKDWASFAREPLGLARFLARQGVPVPRTPRQRVGPR